MAQLKPVPPATNAATPAGQSGKPLPPTLRHQYESQTGQDLSNVRVHEDHRATMVGARAFTRGDDIHFAPGQYQPHDPRGQELLGHELTHVVQQRGGEVRHSTPPGMVRVEPTSGH